MAAGGEALELALGLLRSPAHRNVLWARPLPGGMTELLEVASGSTSAQRSAAERMRVAPDHLREAARFFVQQVLFAANGDAYRVLGGDARSSDALLRRHHRLLLSWLHPDRNPGALEWEETFAHRVNQAWNQVRTPSLRRRYDAMFDPAIEQEEIRPVGVRRPAPGLAVPVAMDQSASRTGPLLVLLLALLCLMLTWVAVRGDGRIVDWDEPPARAHEPHLDAEAGSPQTREIASRPAAVEETPGTSRPERSPKPAAHALPPQREITSIPPATGQQPAASRSLVSGPVPPETTTPEIPSPVPVTAPAVDEPVVAGPAATVVVNDPPAPLQRDTVPVAPASPAPDPYQLLREADATVAHLARYLVSPAVAPPSWRSTAVERTAQAVRTGLESRVAVVHEAQLALHSPNWTLGDEAASLNTAYQLEHLGTTMETGLMHVRLERGLDHWQVASVQLEPAR